jgi:hypothetical protein
MGTNAAERMQTVARCFRELEAVFDATKIQIAGLKGVVSEFKSAGPNCAKHWSYMEKDVAANLNILTALTTSLNALKGRIDQSTMLDRPIKTLQIPDPLYAYEAGEDDSNYHLTGRARQILQSVVTIDENGVASPNMTTFIFGPKGNETELVGWELVGLHSMLVDCPNDLARAGGWSVVKQFKDNERFAPFAESLCRLLPRKKDIGRDKQVGDVKKDEMHAHSEWVNFRKCYDPMCCNKFHKRLCDVLNKMEKRRENGGKRRRKTDDRGFLRLDLPCELSKPLEHDLCCFLKVLNKDRIADPAPGKKKEGWGVCLNDLEHEDQRRLKSILEFYHLSTKQGEMPTPCSLIRQIRSQNNLGAMINLGEVTKYATVSDTRYMPYCAITELYRKGFVSVSSQCDDNDDENQQPSNNPETFSMPPLKSMNPPILMTTQMENALIETMNTPAVTEANLQAIVQILEDSGELKRDQGGDVSLNLQTLSASAKRRLYDLLVVQQPKPETAAKPPMGFQMVEEDDEDDDFDDCY